MPATKTPDSSRGPDGLIDPFHARVSALVTEWVETEWARREAIRQQAAESGWSADYEQRLADATLDSFMLARAVDNMSIAKLRRELEKVGAPPPGELIRAARIAHATKLLTHTRLMVRQIGERCGYRDEKHFKDAFKTATCATPTEFRRDFITGRRGR